MLRAEYCICGTSTTGTGTLTLAACPQPPGGTDLFQAFNAQSLGTSVAIPVSYTIVEYTGSNFQNAVRQEKGIGLLTLGASITATTLARTTVQQTATGMSGATPTYNTAGPSAVSIGTAANVLVFIGASAADLLVCSPYHNPGTFPSDDTTGAFPVNIGGTTTANIEITRSQDNYHLFEWRIPKLVKGLRVELAIDIGGGASLFGRLYAVGLNARPTKLLYNFGTVATSLTIAGLKTSSTSGSGFYLQPGEYFIDLMLSASSSTPPVFTGFSQPYNTGRLGFGGPAGGSVLQINATSASTAAGDPANVTSLDIVDRNQLFFAFI